MNIQKTKGRLKKRLKYWEGRKGPIAAAQKKFHRAQLERLDEKYDSPGKEKGESA